MERFFRKLRCEVSEFCAFTLAIVRFTLSGVTTSVEQSMFGRLRITIVVRNRNILVADLASNVMWIPCQLSARKQKYSAHQKVGDQAYLYHKSV